MRAQDPAWRPPGGETVGEVRERTVGALRRIAAGHAGRNVLVVTHGTAINCMLAAVLDMPLEATFRIAVANCGLNLLSWRQGRWLVSTLNDTGHLSDLEGRR
jgi:broad specificity phosphatase PhoE